MKPLWDVENRPLPYSKSFFILIFTTIIMPRKAKKYNTSVKIGAIVSDSVGNYEKHPFFVKKAEEAKAFLKATGLPTQLKNKKST